LLHFTASFYRNKPLAFLPHDIIGASNKTNETS